MADEYGRQAALIPDSTLEQQLFMCPAGAQFQGIISVMNQTASEQTYSIAHCAAGHGDNPANAADWNRAKDVVLIPGDPPHEYSVNMAPTETIRVKIGEASGIGFGVEGLKMT